MSDVKIAAPKNPEDDWKVWLVLNPATWLMPIFFALLVIALVLHAVVLKMGFGWA